MSYTSGVNAAKMQSAYKWGTWEEGSFTQCGIEVVQHPDFSIQLREEKALTSCPRFTCLEIAVDKPNVQQLTRRNANFPAP